MVTQPIGSRGFVYLTALFATAVMGIGISSYAVVWSQEAKRERERELLSIGAEFKQAIASYYEQSPGAVKQFPGRLDDLLLDSRYLTVKRHLRRLYADPMTGSSSWGTIPAPGGGIMGVYSLSDGSPVKIGGFDAVDADLSNAKRYSEWRFIYVPPALAAVGGVARTVRQ